MWSVTTLKKINSRRVNKSVYICVCVCVYSVKKGMEEYTTEEQEWKCYCARALAKLRTSEKLLLSRVNPTYSFIPSDLKYVMTISVCQALCWLLGSLQ